MKKLIKLLASALLIATILSSCTAHSNDETVSMYDLNKAMSENAGFGEMTYVSSSDDKADEKFSHLSDIDYSKVDSFFMNFAADGSVSSDELAVVVMKDGKDTAEMTSSLEKHVEYRKNLYRNYDPEQLPKLEKALVFSSGRYAVLIVADNPSAIKSAFYSFING